MQQNAEEEPENEANIPAFRNLYCNRQY